MTEQLSTYRESVEEREPSYLVGENVRWCSYYGKLHQLVDPMSEGQGGMN